MCMHADIGCLYLKGHSIGQFEGKPDSCVSTGFRLKLGKYRCMKIAEIILCYFWKKSP